LDNIINAQNPIGHQTSGNITLIDGVGEAHQTTFTQVLVIDVVFVVLGAVTLYYGINRIPQNINQQTNSQLLSNLQLYGKASTAKL
jgi:hypothetical protein